MARRVVLHDAWYLSGKELAELELEELTQEEWKQTLVDEFVEHVKRSEHMASSDSIMDTFRGWRNLYSDSSVKEVCRLAVRHQLQIWDAIQQVTPTPIAMVSLRELCLLRVQRWMGL